MGAGVLRDVSLAYQLLWDTNRQVTGVRLCITPHTNSTCDIAHLLGTLGELWPPSSVPLLLATPSMVMRQALLTMTPVGLARIEVPDKSLQDAAFAQHAMKAARRGLSLVWCGEPGTHVKAADSAYFVQSLLGLSTEEALIGLQIALRKSKGRPSGASSSSPVRAGQWYEGVASQALANHCLDEQGAAALLTWPLEDVLHANRQSRIQPDRLTMARLIEAIDADAPMDLIERGLSEEPILTYRFLRYTNSAGSGLNRDIDSLRQGLMVLGLGRVKTWLLEQMPRASSERNLQPVRISMVLRAQLMASMLDTAEGDSLKRELYLCGLLSQLDQLLGEPLPSALRAIPLPVSITAALYKQSGPYWPYLDMACAMENANTTAIRPLFRTHHQNPEEINLALLRTLAALPRPTTPIL